MSNVWSSSPFAMGTWVVQRPPAAALGQAADDQRWFQRAVDAVAEYDSLVQRASRLANRALRENILSRYWGNPSDRGGPRYRRDSVAEDVSYARSFTPVNYLVFAEQRRRDRIDRLREFNGEFRDEVAAAEAAYGILPEPVQVPGPVQVVTAPPAWLTPVVVGGGAIGLAALLGLI